MSNVTIHDVAKKCGKSRQVVSSVLNNKDYINVSDVTRDLIRETARKLNYQPNRFAQSLKTGKTNTICVTTMLGEVGQFGAPYATLTYRGVGIAFRQTDYQLTIKSYRGSRRFGNMDDLASHKQVDGAVFLLYSGNVAKIRRDGTAMFDRLSIPYVCISSVKEPIGLPNISVDCEEAYFTGTNHLIEHGYDSVGFLEPRVPYEHVEDMKRGYVRALGKAGMPVRPKHQYVVNNFEFSDGYNWAAECLEKKIKLPRSLMVFEEAFAIGMIRKFQEAGISVPDDIAIIGFGNLRDEALGLAGLTCMSQPAAVKGANAADRLLTILDGRERFEPFNEFVESKLVIRSSCGCDEPHTSVV